MKSKSAFSPKCVHLALQILNIHNPVPAVAQGWCRFAPENEHRQTLAEQTDICSIFLDMLIKELQGKAQRRLITM